MTIALKRREEWRGGGGGESSLRVPHEKLDGFEVEGPREGAMAWPQHSVRVAVMIGLSTPSSIKAFAALLISIKLYAFQRSSLATAVGKFHRCNFS